MIKREREREGDRARDRTWKTSGPCALFYRKFCEPVGHEREEEVAVAAAGLAREGHFHVAVGKAALDAAHGARRHVGVGRLPSDQVAHAEGRRGHGGVIFAVGHAQRRHQRPVLVRRLRRHRLQNVG